MLSLSDPVILDLIAFWIQWISQTVLRSMGWFGNTILWWMLLLCSSKIQDQLNMIILWLLFCLLGHVDWNWVLKLNADAQRREKKSTGKCWGNFFTDIFVFLQDWCIFSIQSFEINYDWHDCTKCEATFHQNLSLSLMLCSGLQHTFSPPPRILIRHTFLFFIKFTFAFFCNFDQTHIFIFSLIVFWCRD